jgi:lipopolysaccharide export system permease protein
MGVLGNYLGREVVKGVLVAVLALLTLLNFFTFTDEMGDLGKGDYGLKAIFGYLLLTSPRNFCELMPSGALLGALVTLGALANHRELVAMQASGMSRKSIIGAVLWAGLLLTGFAVLVGEYVAPEAERTAQSLKSTAMKKQVASRTKYGFWLRDGDVYTNIRQIKDQSRLGDISIFAADDAGHLLSATHVRKAEYDGQKWRLFDIRTSRFTGNGIATEQKSEDAWASVLAPDLLNAFVVRPENLSVFELAKYRAFLKGNGQKSPGVDQAFWSRLVAPFGTLVMLLVSVPLLFQARRDISIGHRVVLGTVLGLGFYLFNETFQHLGLVYELNPIFSAAFPVIFVLTLTLLAMWRMRFY